ncbi:DUF2911 domain-containing protein [Rhabdobacter roseus]|uniref:DUF2911 domain-containing protein n=1 Tax=Rhabdobacter roseus TaxID=1655419 RepID=A0A840TUJ2_9BACT|nr:DUF2911 domain-containing protein [Rhabdobacter roseus]MBB5286914.1 hypothetical protein [Rhabdobacter roseus]
MKKYFLSLAFALAVASTTLAQRVPQPSPSAGVMQTVGVTDFTVLYSRPSAKGRAIFGESTLVPYGQLWRTGANATTTIEASTDFTFGGQKVPAGKYALFTIPGGGQWTIILNKNTKATATTYQNTEDVARITAYPSSAPFAESFTISFSDVTDSTAKLNLAWSSVNVPIKLDVTTTQNTLATLEKAVAEHPEDQAVLLSTATYWLSKGYELDRALALTDKAIGLQENFRNVWLKAQILAKMGKQAEALPLAQKALALGATSNDGAYSYMKPQIESGIAAITAKLPTATTTATASKGKKKK